MKLRLAPSIALLFLPLLSGQPPGGRQPQTSPMDTVLVKDWKPDSSLVVPRTEVPRARVPAIDAHSHVYMKTPAEIASWVRVMDETGVETTVILSGATGAEFDRLAGLFLKPHPGRFQLWCGLEARDADKPDYPARAVAELVRCYKMGARGVGELSDKGSGLARGGDSVPRGQRLHPDDPRLDLFWKKCAELKLPINLHIADHPSAWRPPDNRQERLPGYQRYNQYGRDVPSYEELLALRDRLLARHPEPTFILCHFSNQGNDLAALSKVLDRFPNLYVDISARQYEMGRQPRHAAKFLARYKDRVLYGTDLTPNKAMYLSWWRLLETPDEYLPGDAGWRLYGLELPAPVLEAIYRGTALRVLNWQK
jgi:predicted TIM-barrel fold metal-dependent hydrolase